MQTIFLLYYTHFALQILLRIIVKIYVCAPKREEMRILFLLFSDRLKYWMICYLIFRCRAKISNSCTWSTVNAKSNFGVTHENKRDRRGIGDASKHNLTIRWPLAHIKYMHEVYISLHSQVHGMQSPAIERIAMLPSISLNYRQFLLRASCDFGAEVFQNIKVSTSRSAVHFGMKNRSI